jgi:hypothetical protein
MHPDQNEGAGRHGDLSVRPDYAAMKNHKRKGRLTSNVEAAFSCCCADQSRYAIADRIMMSERIHIAFQEGPCTGI